MGGLLPGGLNVRGISGGERRRLSIACGVVGAPRIIALDEPTSGIHPVLPRFQACGSDLLGRCATLTMPFLACLNQEPCHHLADQSW